VRKLGHGGVAGNGGRVDTPDRSVALAEREELVEETQEEAVAEKPEASEEIMIEEINIDGMCGVY
jgi:mycofactocin precursor